MSTMSFSESVDAENDELGLLNEAGEAPASCEIDVCDWESGWKRVVDREGVADLLLDVDEAGVRCNE